MADAGPGTLFDTAWAREAALLMDHWVYLLPIVMLWLAVGGWGRGLGLPSLFREDEQIFSPGRCWRPIAPAAPKPLAWPLSHLPRGTQLALASPALWSGFGFLATFGLFWIAVHGDVAPPCLSARQAPICPTLLFVPGGAGLGIVWLLVALALAAAGFLLQTRHELHRPLADFTVRPPVERHGELLRTAAGCAMGALFALAALLIAFLFGPAWPLPGMALPYIALLIGLYSMRSVLPCLSMTSLMILLILVGTLFPPEWQIWKGFLVIAAIAVVLVVNRGRTRHRLPGFEALYDTPVNPQGDEGRSEPARLIPPQDALKAWHARQAGHPGTAGRKPILVLLATSGGAYRATFWTSLLMDRLVTGSGDAGPWPGLAGNIRLITGASGGMVAGAYFVAMAAEQRLGDGITDRISRDTWARMNARDGDDRRHPIARDSLSPVIHQLVTRDLPRLIVPGRPASDRGQVLERQWTTLARSFDSLRPSEAQGIAPSIILSPMLVETGAVAMFSNLDLLDIRRRAAPQASPAGDRKGAEDKTSVEVFRAFRDTQRTVSMATAVRLNATFPYVSPAITLPTSPDRRVADAGYYDNYGIDLLTAYLDQDATRQWICDNCAGVAILQIRAFPSEPPTRPVKPRWRALQFLTSPVEGIASARRASQIFRNDQQLAQTVQRYENAGGRNFARVFTFEANTDVSLSWYLRCDEMRALHRLLCPPVSEDLVWQPDAIQDRSRAQPSAARPVSRAEIERWTCNRYTAGELVDCAAGDGAAYRKAFMSALQRREPEALWAQFLHHRAKIAEKFGELAEFWNDRQLAAQPQDDPPRPA